MIIEITAVADVKPARRQIAFQRARLAGGAFPQRRRQRGAGQQIELQMHFGGAMVLVQPQRPSHLRQRMQQRAVHGHRAALHRAKTRVRLDVAQALAELFDDRHEQGRIEHGAGLGETAQAKAAQAELALDLLEPAGLLQAAQAGQDGSEKVKQQPGAILVVMQPALGVGTMGVERGEQIEEGRQIFRALNLARFEGWLGLAPALVRGRLAHAGIMLKPGSTYKLELRERSVGPP